LSHDLFRHNQDAYRTSLKLLNEKGKSASVSYLDNQRDMADEIFDRNAASQMKLGEAVVLGILNSPGYILSVFSYKENLKKYESRIKKSGNAAVQKQQTP